MTTQDPGAETAIRGGAIRVVGYLSGVTVSLGSATILVRHLGIATFGRYVTVASLVALVGGISEAGIAAFGIRELAVRSQDARQRLLSDLLGLRLILAALGVIGAVCFALIAGYEGVLVIGTLLVGVGLLTQVFTDVLSIPLQSDLRLGRLTFVDLVRRALALASIAALAAAGATLLPFFAVPICAGLAALALLVWIIRGSLRVRITFDRQRSRALLTETLPFAVAVSIGAIYFYATIVLMSLIASELQTGYFATSFRVTQVALAIPALVLTAVFPLMARGGAERGPAVGEQIGRVFDVALILGVWMSIVMLLGARFVIDVIAGGAGAGAVSVLQIQGAVLTASFVSATSMFGLLALRRYRPMLLASGAALVFNILLGLLLVPQLGARGGAISDVTTEALVAIGLFVALLRTLGPGTVRVRAIGRVAIAALPAVATILVPVAPVSRAVLASVVYFGIMLILGGIPDEVTSALHNLRTRRG